MLTQDGRCKTLDAAADGYVRAEACIVIYMTAGLAAGSEPSGRAQPASTAATDSASGTAIVLLGSFVNQVGLTASSHVAYFTCNSKALTLVSYKDKRSGVKWTGIVRGSYLAASRGTTNTSIFVSWKQQVGPGKTYACIYHVH